MNYNDQVKADRRAAALERRAEKAQGFATELDERRAMYAKTNNAEPKARMASINRRLAGRLAHLAALGQGFNDTHLFLLQELSLVHTNDQLLAKYQGQTSTLWHLDPMIVKKFNLVPTVQHGIQDDGEATTNTPWAAWFVDEAQVPEIKQFIRDIVAESKAKAEAKVV